ncbi:MAG: sulfotransferase [Candidatus Nealsonbacteria bacterium]
MENTKIPVIYIVGSGHCGSTLLDLIMGAHSKIMGVGEFENYPVRSSEKEKTICTCKKTLADCPFWNEVFKDIPENQDFTAYRSKIKFLLGLKNFVDKRKFQKIDIEKYLKLHEKVYGNILACSGKKIVLDSSKDSNRAELLLLSKKLDIILIHLVRNGKAVMWSYKRKYGGVFSPLIRWLGNNLKIEVLKKRNKNAKIIFVRYKDLVRNPEKELTRILGKTGLSFEPGMLDFWSVEHHQVEGNRLRLRGDKEIKEDLAWKEKLPKSNIFIFNLLAGWLNKIYKL